MKKQPPKPHKRAPKPPAREPAQAPAPVVDRRADGIPIVGIGASAGGLEALETFFRAVPATSGLGYVVVQHLDPTHTNMLAELLQRVTAIPVAQVTDGTKVAADHVYVIPPNTDMSVMHGRLQLLPRAHVRGLNLPIDFFLRSLAEDRQERSIGVILSGMGSDGTLGLRAIKEKAGASFVQTPESAKHDGMPRSAIESGFADVVAPVEELPARIIANYTHTPRTAIGASLENRAQNALDKVFVLLRAHTGNDFSNYKTSTLIRRIERRMGLHQISELSHYVRLLRETPREVELLFRELLIGVTSFFRDPSAWDLLQEQVLPALLESRASGSVLRAWIPGCSTGEEAYSLAIVFREVVEQLSPMRNLKLQIFATDLDREAIDRARAGVYPESIAADVSAERLHRFFVQDDRGFRVGKDIREMVAFATQNVTTDPPFTKIDILSCRNLLIYFSGELQKKLIPLFQYSLNPGGVLFLGTSETIGPTSETFVSLDSKTRLYRRLEQSIGSLPMTLPPAVLAPTVPPEQVTHKPPPNLQTLVDRLLVQRVAPLGLLCNDKGDILYTSGRAGKYFEPAVGKANLNLFSMARDGLRYELDSAFSTAVRHDRVVTVHDVKVGTNGGTQVIDLTVQRLTEPRELRGTVLVVIADVDPAAKSKVKTKTKSKRPADRSRVAELEQQLDRAREEVHSAREQMQSSQEELKSANEELQSTNEELQSSNEELTTSKEEMQSLNEELQTVNHELEAKVDELWRSNNDMKNLLNSTDIATLFLDTELNVRRFTTPTAKIIKLIASDIGRPITDIASELEYRELAEDAREVLRTRVAKEVQAGTRDGTWFDVRILPYRTLENRIDGVVITFTDVSGARTLASALREQMSQFRQMAESLPSLVWACRPDGSCDYLSPQWVDYTGVPEQEHLGFGWLEHVHPDERERVRDEWRAAVGHVRPFDSEFRLRGRDGAYRWFKTRSIPIRDSLGAVQKWYGTSTDIDDVKRPRDVKR